MSTARKPYPSDLKDEQWIIIEPLVPAGLPGGRPLKYERREIVNAILYALRAGCAWRMVPHDLPAWESVYAAFAAWEADGSWGRIEAELRRRVRRAAGKRAAPTAAILDSQSVKRADQGGPRGHDVAKQTTGRKRHLLVDTLGLILAVSVTAASVQDHDGAREPLRCLATTIGLGWVRRVWADSAYRAHALAAWIKALLPGRGLKLEIVERRAGAKGFQVQPRRWVIERTFAWLGKCRRLAKDYERRTDRSEAMIRVASIGLMVRRLSPKPAF